MSFPFNIYLLAFSSALLASAFSLPLWKRWSEKTGLLDDPGHRKIHAKPIPLAGGLAVLTGILLPLLLSLLLLVWLQSPLAPPEFSRATSAFLLQYGFGRRATELIAIIAGAVGILAVGFLDDRYELPPLKKFAGQVLVTLLVAASGIRITLFVPSILVSYLLTLLWVLTLINAFNFMDNMNGLCAGLGLLSAGCFAVAAAAQGQYFVALLALLALGALAGFLPFNFPHARAFLGDSGSHLIGYLMAVLSILPHFHSAENPRPAAVLLPLFILGVPLLDLAWVVILRWRLGRPFYQGDTNHLSHRLVRAGFTRTTAVLLIWLAAAALAAAGFWILRADGS